MENQKIKDPLTGEWFIPNRPNQIYASRANQIKFNNEKQKHNRKDNAIINKHISNNKKILKTILGDAKEVVKSKDFLLGAGFRFEYFTHYLNYQGQWAYANYNYCIVPIDKSTYKIFKNV